VKYRWKVRTRADGQSVKNPDGLTNGPGRENEKWRLSRIPGGVRESPEMWTGPEGWVLSAGSGKRSS
jgi:hypothetical protein